MTDERDEIPSLPMGVGRQTIQPMAFTDLDEHLAEAFSRRGHEMARYEEPRGPDAFTVRRPGRKPVTSQFERLKRSRDEVERRRRWIVLRRAKEARDRGLFQCLRPGCHNLLPPPGSIRQSCVPETCSPRCCNAVGHLRRTRRLPPRPR